MLKRITAKAGSLNGKDALRDGRAMPASMIHCFDATQGDLQGNVTDLVTGLTVQYPSASGISFDSGGRMVGVDEGIGAGATRVLDEIGVQHTSVSGDATLFICCGQVIDEHAPLIGGSLANNADNKFFGCDPYGVVMGEDVGDGIAGAAEATTGVPDITSNFYGSVGYVDDTNGHAYKYSPYQNTFIIDNVGGAPFGATTGIEETYDISLSPSPTGEAFLAIMRWPAGSHPPLSVVQDGMRWMYWQWSLGNYTIYPPLLNY